MKEYKRLTEKMLGTYLANCKNCIFGNPSINCSAIRCKDVLLNRLAELEDKIENGTLVEMGYHIRKSYRNHDDQRYKITLVDEVEIDKIGYDGLTKSQAEEKLKELRKDD